MRYFAIFCFLFSLGSIDNLSSASQSPTAFPRDPEILLNTKHSRAKTDQPRSHKQAVGRRDLNGQQTPSAAFSNQLAAVPSTFDIKKANQQFDRINLQLSVQNLNLNSLNAAVDTLSDLSAGAEQCIDDVQKKLTNLDLLIKQVGSASERDKPSADLLYLTSQQKTLANEQAQCRLFSIRAKEAIDAYRAASTQLKQAEALTRGIPLWTNINQLINNPPSIPANSHLSDSLPHTLSPYVPYLWILGLSLLLSPVLLIKLRQSRFARRYLRFSKRYTHYLILQTLFLLSGGLFGYLVFKENDPTHISLAVTLSELLFFYLSACVIVFILFSLKKIIAFFYWYSLEQHFFKSLIITLITFYALSEIGKTITYVINTYNASWQLIQNLFLLTIIATGAYFIPLFCKTHRHLAFIKRYNAWITRLSAIFFISCAFIDAFGYQILARYLIISGFTTFVILFLTWLITQGIHKLYLNLYQQQTTHTRMINYFGYKTDQVFTEFLILKTTLQLLVIAVSLYLIGESWGFATDYTEILFDQLLNGIHVVHIMLYPTRIVLGIVVFCLLYLTCRALSTSISRHQQFENEEETQVAIASILTYIGFSLALITGFLVAGFDFTGLAIIAGALSVGIGLGLQSIVNNFVSGLILLIEKPIRPGDRISVDGIEGFVKKIRVRSTQLISPAHEDIIVPNSDLITRRVVNYMFSDKYCRIHCDLHIAYGSDTNLVRELLMKIANNHEEIIKSGRNKPNVLFLSFSEKSLIFQLGCLIKDVNKKSLVQSDLNFSIDQAFREHGISMT